MTTPVSRATQHDLLFVYGSLRKGSRHPYGLMLERRAHWLGLAYLPARLYRISTYCGAVPADVQPAVTGDLYELPPQPQSLLRWLDRYEGCEAGGESPEFLRTELPVGTRRGQWVIAQVYVYRRDPGDAPLIPSGDFLAMGTGTRQRKR